MQTPRITDGEFQAFRDFFYSQTGIWFESTKRYYVDRRLLERMAAVKVATVADYLNLLRRDRTGAELQTVINALTVNETYFYREPHQFRNLVQWILPEVVAHKRSGDRLRFWVIPCSTGEEVYSIAIYLLEHWPDLDRWDVELTASDIDTEALAIAQQGLYSHRAVQQLPRAILHKYFEETAEGYRITPTLREVVRFTRVNLCHPVDTKRYRGFDVIFCRNLLIYFDEVSRKVAATHLYDALNPGGYVCLGSAETLGSVLARYRTRRLPDGVVYQKPREGLGQ